MQKTSAVEGLVVAAVWLVVVGGLLTWYICAAAARSRRRVEAMNSPMDAWNAYYAGGPYAAPAPWSATAEGSPCPCRRGYRILRHGEFGPFLGCSTWIDPDHGCQRACFPNGQPLPPALWRRNRRRWPWPA